MSEHHHQSSADPILDAQALEHDYGSISVLEDVSLPIDRGVVTGLIGPNGSGKTTLLRVLAGLLEPTNGTVTYHGGETTRRIGYLPQHPAFRPGFTVAESLAFYAALVGENEEAAMERLEQVGLSDAATRPVDALSGGMTRLVGIAQATIGDPPVIVLDEPASGLDPGMSRHVFDVAGDLAAAGTAVILSSHDLELVDRHADEVVVLDDGSIATHGRPAALRESLAVDSLRDVYDASISGETTTVRVQGVSS